MNDNKLEELITNLELAGHKLDKVLEEDHQVKDSRALIGEASEIIRKTLDDLRTVELKREIESYSGTELPE